MVSFKYIVGAFLILVGISGIFNIFGFFNIWSFLWPIFIIIIGIYIFIRKHKTFGALLILFGLLVLSARILSISVIKLFFPILLIYFGATLFGFRPKFFINKTKSSTDNKAENIDTVTTNRLNKFIMFGGYENKVKSRDFEGGEVVTIFGASKIDLSDTRIAEKGGKLNVVAIFGGAEIIVPENMNVKLEGSSVFGGWEDKTNGNIKGSQESLIIIEGISVFGAISIRN